MNRADGAWLLEVCHLSLWLLKNTTIFFSSSTHKQELPPSYNYNSPPTE